MSVADVDRWHRLRGFLCIGYHYLIYLDGSIHKGRSIHHAGAHCTGHNSCSIGVCYVGGCDAEMNPKDTRTPAQRIALHYLVDSLLSQYPDAKVYGHRDFAAKACPSFDVHAEEWGSSSVI